MAYRTPRAPQFSIGDRVRIRENGIGDDWGGMVGTVTMIQPIYRPMRYEVRMDTPIPRSDGIRSMEKVIIPEWNLELAE